MSYIREKCIHPFFTRSVRNTKVGYNAAVWWNRREIGLFYKHFPGSKLRRKCGNLPSKAPLNND